MTQEEKDLLFKDLCGRQTYNVKCQVFDDADSYTLSGVLHNKPYSQLYFEELDWKEFDGFVGIEYCKPYLFPMTSMTDEQKTEWDYIDYYADHHEAVDWLNKNYFDYRGLIDMGLALDATNLNIY
jgi:hypothetical protein